MFPNAFALSEHECFSFCCWTYLLILTGGLFQPYAKLPLYYPNNIIKSNIENQFIGNL